MAENNKNKWQLVSEKPRALDPHVERTVNEIYENLEYQHKQRSQEIDCWRGQIARLENRKAELDKQANSLQEQILDAKRAENLRLLNVPLTPDEYVEDLMRFWRDTKDDINQLEYSISRLRQEISMAEMTQRRLLQEMQNLSTDTGIRSDRTEALWAERLNTQPIAVM